MAVYMRNRRCSCTRCRTHGLMGAAVLVTLGVLFLLQSNEIVWFHQSWPVLLLVIGLMMFFSRSASTENHIQPYGAPAVTTIPASAPTSTPASGISGTPPASGSEQNNSQVQP